MRGIARGVFAALGIASLLLTLLVLSPSAVSAAAAPLAPGEGPVIGLKPVDTTAQPVEVVSKRAENAKHYRMPDGTMRAEVHAAPIHFKDESGSWTPFDNTLEPSGVPGESKNAAGPFDARFRNGTPGTKPVTFSRDGWSVSMDLVGGTEGQHTDLGNKAHYAAVFPATDIDYEVEDSGLKETLTLHSPAAPATFTFHVTLSGVELRDMGSGVWALCLPGKLEPVLYLGGLSVWDANGNSEAGPFAEDTSITVTPTTDGAFITYSIPRSWLDDASRAYPVKVDPSFTSAIDGYIDQTYTSNSFGTQTTMKVGRTAGNKLQYSMFQFDLSSIPTYSYVYAATAKVYKDGATSSGTFTETLNNCTSAWSESTTWNTRPTQSFLASQTVDASSGWIEWDVRTTVSSWVNASSTNYGFQIQPSTSTTGVAHAFYTHEYTTDTTKRPTLSVDYWDSNAAASVTQSLTDTSSTAYTYASDDTSEVVEVINLNSTWPEDVQEVRIIPNYASGTSSRYGGYMAWFRDKSLIPGGWATFASPYGGWFAYTQNQFGSEKITPLLHRCYVTPDSQPGTKSVEFHYRIKDNWGNEQNNTPDYYVAMGKGSSTWEIPWRTGEATFSVVPSPVSMNCDKDKSDETPGTWWTEPSAGANNDTTSGRGSIRLEWKPLSSATGYKVYLHDGNTWQQVGQTFSSTATTWTSAGAGMLPKDSGIASWSDGYTGNPFARGSSPSVANQDDSFSPTSTAGDGVIATDGTYLYVRAWSNYAGPTMWTKIGSGFGGTTKGTNYGTVGPDFASKTILSGFYSGGQLYNGYADSATTVTRVNASTGATSTFTFSSALLNRSTGNSLTGASGGILLAADSTGIYSVASSLGTGNYDGWRVKKYDLNGTYVGTYSIPAPSYYTDGVLVDTNNMYFIEWTGTDAARVTKVRKADWSVANQWTIDQGAKRVINGCYDTTNNVFWLGKLDASGIYRYRGLGFELRDDPSRLYAKMGSGSRANDTHYRFKVIPVNSADSSNFTPSSSYGAMSTDYYTTLPNRTYGINDDPRHAQADFGEAAKHNMSAWLDDAALHASTTDLSIASWGPNASLSRTYDSGNSTANYFAAGWRFNFEQSLTSSGSDKLYTDADGIQHKFRYSGGAYVAPRGFHATLANGTDWILDFPAEGRTLKFDSITGKLKSETDDNGNMTTYVWTGDDLTITASNEQTIVVDVSGGKVTSASYSTSAGTRQVNYSTSATPTVTYYPNTSAAYSVQYAYDASNRLTELHVPSATFEVAGNVPARWKFEYSGSSLTTHLAPGVSPSAPATTVIGYLGSSASLTRDNDVTTDTVETYTWDSTNKTTTSHALPKYSGETATPTECYAYGPGNEIVKTTSPLGFQDRAAIDGRGLTVAEVDQVGLVTTSSYDSSLRLSSENDPRGSTTTYTYNGSTRDVAQETKALETSDATSGTKHTYDSAGLMLTEQKLINDGTTWITTASYGKYAPCGESQETSIPSVTIDASSSPVTVTTSKVIDAFGNVTSETDASGTVTVRTDYDIAGRAVTSTDAAAAVTHNLYDVFGNEIETSVTAGSAFTGWTRRTIDPLGRLVKDEVLASADVVDHYTTHAFDALGRETAKVGSIEGTSTSTFDARGNTLTSAGADGTTTMSEYDLDGRTTKTWNPGETTPTATTYDAAGRATYVVNPNGTYTSTTYDAEGDVVYETTPANDSGTTSTTSLTTYDLAGRIAYSVKDALGRGYSATVFSHDRLNRQLTAGLGQNVASSASYNTLGWMLSDTHADGIETAFAYDRTGRKARESIAGNITSHTFDSLGRTTRTNNPDGSSLTYEYDAFGRTTNEKHDTAAGEIKNITMTYDTLGRVDSSMDNKANVSHSFVYPTGATKAGTETVTYSTGAKVSIAFDALGRETSRVATSAGSPVYHNITDIARDEAGRPLSWKVYTNSQTAAYDAAGRMIRQGGQGFASGSGATYTIDPVTGRKVSESYGLSGGTGTGTYSYTTDGKLANANITGSVSTSYDYDAAGNLISVSPSGSSATTMSYETTTNRLVSKGASKFYGFDDLGRRVAQGPSNAPSQTVFGWDDSSHLVSLVNTSTVTTGTYEYDANGQRTKSVVTQNSNTTTTTYTYEGLALLSLNASSTTGGSWSIDYLYNESGRPVGGFYRENSGTAERFYLITNDRGDVVEIIRPSNGNNTVYRYDAWGTPTSVPTDTLALRQPLRYAGYCWDSNIAMYYVSARYYDPYTWQWISKDPAKADGEESAYQYARGNPVENVDPNGLESGKQMELSHKTTWAQSTQKSVYMKWRGIRTHEYLHNNLPISCTAICHTHPEQKKWLITKQGKKNGFPFSAEVPFYAHNNSYTVSRNIKVKVYRHVLKYGGGSYWSGWNEDAKMLKPRKAINYRYFYCAAERMVDKIKVTARVYTAGWTHLKTWTVEKSFPQQDLPW